MNTNVIAEAGVNHNGNEELAFKLIDEACLAGADIIKFQTFKAEKLVTKSASKADYQIKNTGLIESQFDMLKRLELSFEAFERLANYCKDSDIEFLSTAFDNDSLDFLVKGLGLTKLKIPSGEITNAPFLLEHAKTRANIILSTGMASLGEIEAALSVLAFGYLSPNIEPSRENFARVYNSVEGYQVLCEKVCLLHCTTEYPAPIDSVNLNSIETLSNAFKLPVGYSDHTEGVFASIAATACGARLIEKHFTLDKNMSGPDHKASLSPGELKELVDGVKKTARAMGNGIKGPHGAEFNNRAVVRKSIVAVNTISKGEVITERDIAVMRPGGGVSPYYFWEMIGTVANRDYIPGDLILF